NYMILFFFQAEDGIRDFHVTGVQTCALPILHSIWTPVADEFDDYISRPKPNGYRSLHTVVLDEEGRAFEIQIRTEEMHHFAEYRSEERRVGKERSGLCAW